MSLTMNIELSTDGGLGVIGEAISSMAGNVREESEAKIVAEIGAVSVVAYVSDPPSETVTESFDNPTNWRVGYRISLRFHSDDHDAAMRDIRHFIEILAKSCIAEFVLSFQYEEMYAFRNATGLHFVMDFGVG